MISYKEIEEKIKSMSAHDIIMAMVEGLRNPKTKIDMSTFGEIRGEVCYGCAVTNAIMHIIDANENEVKSHVIRRSAYAFSGSFLSEFESAIDYLRMGYAHYYNSCAMQAGFAQITPMPGQKLPELGDYYTKDQLQEYEKLAKYQLTIKTQTND